MAAKRIEGLFYLEESQLPAVQALRSFLPAAAEAPEAPELHKGTAVSFRGASFKWESQEVGRCVGNHISMEFDGNRWEISEN